MILLPRNWPGTTLDNLGQPGLDDPRFPKSLIPILDQGWPMWRKASQLNAWAGASMQHPPIPSAVNFGPRQDGQSFVRYAAELASNEALTARRCLSVC